MRRASALMAGLWLTACSATGGDLTGEDASADHPPGPTDAPGDRSLADEGEGDADLLDGNRAESGADLPDGARADVGPDGAGDAKDTALDLPELGGDTSSETADWLCPGHREPCLAGDCNPFIRIQTTDGSASITSVRALAGGCVIDKIASPSGRDVQVVDGGIQAAAALVVFVDSSCVPTADCSFEVSFASGGSTVITTRYSLGAPIKVMFCIDNANCCPPSLYFEQVASPCGFGPWDFVVDVPVGTDSGGLPIDGGRESVDGGVTGN